MALTLTKFTHACVRIEAPSTAIVLDPGGFAEEAEHARALDAAAAVLVTHEHADHVVPGRLSAELRRRGDLPVWAPRAVLDQLIEAEPGLDRQLLHLSEPQQTFEVGEVGVQTWGGRHAVIHPLIDAGFIDNVGFLLTEQGGSGAGIYHPVTPSPFRRRPSTPCWHPCTHRGQSSPK